MARVWYAATEAGILAEMAEVYRRTVNREKK